MFNKILIFALSISSVFSGLQAGQKMYLDSKEVKSKHDRFYIHLGENHWIQASSLQRDASGLYTLDTNIKRNPTTSEWEQAWKCPYCYKYWPIGTKCQNASCPSKY